MKNPLLVPELREMLTSHRVDEIRDFCAFTPPEVTAEFLSALHADEARTILEMLEPEMRSLVFASMEDEAKLSILGLLDENAAVEIVAGMPEHARDGFLERLPVDQQQRLREKFQRAEPEEAQPLLEAMDEALMPEPEKLEELSPEEIANEVNQHLENYRFEGGRVERVPRPERGCWVRIVNPSKDNLPLIAEHFKVPIDFLTAALDLDETARIEIDEQATLFIVKIPYYDENRADVLYFTIPVGIILVGGHDPDHLHPGDQHPAGLRREQGPTRDRGPPVHPAVLAAGDGALPAISEAAEQCRQHHSEKAGAGISQQTADQAVQHREEPGLFHDLAEEQHADAGAHAPAGACWR